MAPSKFEGNKNAQVLNLTEEAVKAIASADRGTMTPTEALKQAALLAEALNPSDIVLVRNAAKTLEKKDPAGFKRFEAALTAREQAAQSKALEKQRVQSARAGALTQAAEAARKSDEENLNAWRKVIKGATSGESVAASQRSRGEFPAVKREPLSGQDEPARVISPVEIFSAQAALRQQSESEQAEEVTRLQNRAVETGRPSRVGSASGEVKIVNEKGNVLISPGQIPRSLLRILEMV